MLNRFLKNKLEANFLIYLFGKIISAGVMIASIPVFMDVFGVEGYGEFMFFYTTFLMLFAGSSGWIVQGVLRFSSLEKDANKMREEIFQMALKSFLVFGVVLIAVFSYCSASFTLIITALFTLLLSIFYATNIAIEQALMNSKNFIKAEIIRTISFFFIPIILSLLFNKENSILLLFIGLFFSYFFGLLWLSKGVVYIPKLSFKKTRWTTIFIKYGMPLSIWVVFSPTTNGVDRYIIEFSLGSIALAKYVAIFDVVFKLFSNLSVPFNNIVQPLLIESYNNKDIKEYKKTMFRAVKYLSLVFIVFLIVGMVFKSFVICEYLSFCTEIDFLSKLILPLILSSYVWQLSVLLQKNIEVSNRTLEMTIYMFVIVVVIVVLGILFVPKYGLIASAYISLISALIYLSLILYGTNKHFNI